jgi:hypothetical protein
MTVDFQRTTRRYIPDDLRHSHHHHYHRLQLLQILARIRWKLKFKSYEQFRTRHDRLHPDPSRLF